MILVCAATGTEAAACRRGIADAGAPGIEVLATGVGPGRAAEALARWLAREPERWAGTSLAVRPERSAARSKGERPSLVVSAGFAGALSPGIEPLSWVTASAVYRLEGGRAVPVVLSPGLLRVAEGATACSVVSASQVVAGGVREIGGAAAADMESAALAEIAGAAGLPFLVLRLVTDTPARPLAAVGRSLAAALAARGVASRVAHGARAALAAARSPLRAAAFLRDTAVWRDQLRAGWRDHARRGVPSAVAG